MVKGSSTTNSHGVATFDFATVSGCDQLVVGPTHARDGILDLLMTDVPDLIRVVVVAPIGNSDYSSLSALISTAEAVPNLCVSRKDFLKHQVNWNTVCGAMRDLPWRNIWSFANPVEVWSSSSSSRIRLITLLFQLFIAFTERKKKVPFSMAIINGELMHECFPKHLRMGKARMKLDIETDEEDKKRGMSVERSKAGTKKRSPDGLSHPNQNTIIINKIW